MFVFLKICSKISAYDFKQVQFLLQVCVVIQIGLSITGISVAYIADSESEAHRILIFEMMLFVLLIDGVINYLFQDLFQRYVVI